MSQDVIAAFLATADHFGVPVSDVTRDMIRQAREQEIHSVAERTIGNHAAARAQAGAQQAPLVPIPKGHHVKGVSTLVGPDGATKGQWVKTAKTYESREEILGRLMGEIPDIVPARKGPIVVHQTEHWRDDLLAVYPMGDPHIGMLSWAPETGNDFDLKIAQRLAENAIDQLVGNFPKARQALVLNLGDFFHSDTKRNTTTLGTDVDVDGRMFKILRVGRDLMIYTIDACLRTHQEVLVDNRNGNHDKVTSMFLALALESHYRNEPRVTINISPSSFFYHRFGLNLIGATHGDTVKLGELQKIMSVDRRSDWGEVDHCFWYCGHVHHTKRVEDYGCVIETFRTLAPADEWHHSKGYRSSRDMNRILLHRELGEVSRSIVTASALERQYRATIDA